MDWPTPNLADVLRARAALSPYLRPTPTLEPPALGAALANTASFSLLNVHLDPWARSPALERLAIRLSAIVTQKKKDE